jgi:hypothetical protein
MDQILDYSVPKSTTLWSGSGEKGGEFSLHVLRAFKGASVTRFSTESFYRALVSSLSLVMIFVFLNYFT